MNMDSEAFLYKTQQMTVCISFTPYIIQPSPLWPCCNHLMYPYAKSDQRLRSARVPHFPFLVVG